MADGGDKSGPEDERRRLQDNVRYAARVLLDFERIAAFSVPFEPLPVKQPRFVVAGTSADILDLSGGMTEARAREILGSAVQSDDTIDGYIDEQFYELMEGGDETADWLEAIAWWIRNKKVTT